MVLQDISPEGWVRIAHCLAAAWTVNGWLSMALKGSRYQKLLFWQKRKPIRVWIDGCYDVTHFGHFNAFRQARALGDYLIVGLNPDKEVEKHKGTAPLMTDEERYAVVKACKWVDEVVRDVPYVLDEKYLNEVVFGKYECDLVVHGDDPCLDANGNDVYATSKAVGKYREIKRTEGVSTTDLVGRMLLMTREHHTSMKGKDKRSSAPFKAINFLPTSRRIAQFSSNRRPKPTDRVVYVDGAFDLFHATHVEFLKKAKEFGDFVIVGVHKDEVVNKYKGENFPIMNLQERTLGVLSCRYADEVIIGAPWNVTEDMIRTLNITTVMHGSTYDETVNGQEDYQAAYKVPRQKGIFKEVDSSSTLSVMDIVQRIMNQRQKMEAKFTKKNAQEEKYYKQKSFVEEK